MSSLVKASMDKPLISFSTTFVRVQARSLMCKTTGLFVLSLLLYGLVGCEAPNCDSDTCTISAELDPPTPTKLAFKKNTTSSINVNIKGRDVENNDKLFASFDQVNAGELISKNLTLRLVKDNQYQIDITPDVLISFKSGDIKLQISQGVRKAAPIVFGLANRDISYSANPAMSASQSYPVLERLGFIDTTLVTLRSGLDGGMRPSKVIRQYAWMQNKFNTADVTTDYFYQNVFAGKSLATTSIKNVYLLRELPAGMELDRCPVDPMDATACPPFNPQFPLGTQAFTVSADGAVGVHADPDGKLNASGLGSMNLTWQPLPVVMAQPASAAVQLAMGDIDGDKIPDLVAVWQGAGSPVLGVLRGVVGGGFTADSGLAAQLQIALGTDPVDALAVADVDQDGYADLVVGQGRKLRVIYNQWDGCVEAFSALLDPTQSGAKITAIAVGKLDNSIDATKLLDVVVASNSTPDMAGKVTLYLQAFRGQ